MFIEIVERTTRKTIVRYPVENTEKKPPSHQVCSANAWA
jgi:hypothetical protein